MPQSLCSRGERISGIAQKREAAALRCASELAGLGGWEIDFRTGDVFWSEAIWRLLGGEPAPVDLATAMEIYDVEDRPRVLAILDEARRTGRVAAFEAAVTAYDGRRLWIRVLGEPELDGDECVVLRGAAQDITEQHRALRDLQEAERIASGILDGVSAPVGVIDAGGRILAANRAWRAAAPPGCEVAGSHISAFIAAPDGRFGRGLSRRLRELLEGRTNGFTFSFPRGTQGKDWVQVTASRFAGEGAPRFVVLVQSIDKLKRAEGRLRRLNRNLKMARDAADEANVAKSMFLACMSHEIRTPLNAVLGMAQAMAGGELSESQRRRLEVMREAGESLLNLLNDLLDLSRAEAGRLPISDGLVDVEEIAESVRQTFSALASEKDLVVECKVSPSAARPFRGDPHRIRQVIANLVTNAIKFTDRGKVEIAADYDGKALWVDVGDTGPGIPPDKLGCIFDKFVQADASDTRRYGGSGLGLAICRELVGLMGGYISVRSELGQGSTFSVCLPLRPTQHPTPSVVVPEAPGSDPAEPALAGRIRVLAAEDNRTNQLVLQTLLSPLDVDLHVVENGADAVKAWEEGSWDLVLMDVQMPVMDGLTATRAIRALEAAEGRLRTTIIALTANAMPHQVEECLAAGMDDVVAKPIQFAQLLGALQKAA